MQTLPKWLGSSSCSAIAVFGQERLTKMVVFTDKDDGETPESSHVEGLKDLPLICCTVTIAAAESVPSAKHTYI